MKLVINREALLAGIATADHAAGPTPRPFNFIYKPAESEEASNKREAEERERWAKVTEAARVFCAVHMTATADGLVLRTTDGKGTHLSHTLPAAVEQPGVVVIEPGRLVKILREFRDADVSLELTGRPAVLKVKLSGPWYAVPPLDPDSYPAPAAFDADGGVEVPAAELAGAMRWAHAARFQGDDDESAIMRWQTLRGTLIEMGYKGEGAVAVVGTDSKILTATTIPAACPAPAAAVLGGPQAKAVASVLESLPPETTVRLHVGRGVTVAAAGLSMSVPTLEGRYPPWRDILPKKARVKLALDGPAFLSSVRMIAIMAAKPDESPKMECVFADGKLALSTKSDHGSADVELAVDLKAGDDLTITLDPHLTLRLLDRLNGDPVTLEMTDGVKPALFAIGERTRCLIMPLAG